jgi:hypothetical protein
VAIAESAIFAITFFAFGLASLVNFEATRINQPFAVFVARVGKRLLH